MANPTVTSPIYPISAVQVQEVKALALSNTPVLLFTGDVDIHYMKVDNSLNSDDTFIKLYASVSVTYASDVPDAYFKIPAGVNKTIRFNPVGDVGNALVMDTGLSVAASSVATLDGAAPTNTIDVTFGIS